MSFTLDMVEEAYPWTNEKGEAAISLLHEADKILIEIIGDEVPTSKSWGDFWDTITVARERKLLTRANLLKFANRFDQLDELGQRVKCEWEAVQPEKYDNVFQRTVVKKINNKVRRRLLDKSKLVVKTTGGRYLLNFILGFTDAFGYVAEQMQGFQPPASRFAGRASASANVVTKPFQGFPI